MSVELSQGVINPLEKFNAAAGSEPSATDTCILKLHMADRGLRGIW